MLYRLFFTENKSLTPRCQSLFATRQQLQRYDNFLDWKKKVSILQYSPTKKEVPACRERHFDSPDTGQNATKQKSGDPQSGNQIHRLKNLHFSVACGGKTSVNAGGVKFSWTEYSLCREKVVSLQHISIAFVFHKSRLANL